MDAWLLVAAYFVIAEGSPVVQMDVYPEPFSTQQACVKERDAQAQRITEAAKKNRPELKVVGYAIECVQAPIHELKEQAPATTKSGQVIPLPPTGPLGNVLEYRTQSDGNGIG